MVSVVHIHFGPGKLGLGLLVWTSLAARFAVHVVARPGSPVDAGTVLEIVPSSTDGNDGKPEALEVATICQAEALEELAPEARTGIDEAENLLITTAVTTSGISTIASLIVDIAEMRIGDDRHTTFIAGENNPGPDFDSLVVQLQARGVDCRRTMVDRLCFEPEGLARRGARVVRVDTLKEWVIEGPPNSATLAALDQLDHVKFVDDVDPLELRKRWLVNGGHLALAIMARDRNYEGLDIAAAEPGRTEWLDRYHAAVIAVLERNYPGLEGNAEYARDRVRAWIRHEDPVTRVLSRLRRANLEPFLRDLHRKIGEPFVADDIDRDDPSWQPVEDLFAILHHLLCTPEQYLDQAAIHDNPALLDRAVDDRCVGMYRDWLSRIVGPRVGQKRADELAEVFEHQRATEAR